MGIAECGPAVARAASRVGEAMAGRLRSERKKRSRGRLPAEALAEAGQRAAQ